MLEREAEERAAELEAAEEEKYLLSSDLEVLQEELEDANAHQKRYYEALMSKEAQLREMKARPVVPPPSPPPLRSCAR